MKLRKYILLFALMTAASWAGVSVEIQNVVLNTDLDAGTLDIYMINQSGCSYCTDNTYNNQSDCVLYGDDGNASWVFDNIMSEADCVGVGDWFNGEVGGFQFELFDITITDATSPSGFVVSTTSSIILGFSFTGATIPAGEGILTTVSFSDYEGSDICFGTNLENNVISDAIGGSVSTEWGDSSSSTASDGARDGDGVAD